MTTYNRQSLFEIIHPIFGTAPNHGKNSKGENTTEVGIAIVLAESGGDTTATNLGGRVVGAWQIDRQAHPDVSVTCARNMVCSTRAALKISNGGEDFSPWDTYKNGAYKKFLKDTGGSVPNADSGILGSGIGSPLDLGNPLDWAKQIGKLIAALFDPSTYLRLGKGLLGGVFIIAGTGALVFIVANKATNGGATKAVEAAALA